MMCVINFVCALSQLQGVSGNGLGDGNQFPGFVGEGG